jgi:pyrroloquinoline quinone (PQQ) biosynthesis protein C
MAFGDSETAKNEIQKQVEATYRALTRYPWRSREKYAAWLAQTYFYVKQVSRVLAAAAARTPETHAELHDHFLRAITEEKEHGLLALQDLEDLGYTIDDFSEHPLTTAYYLTLFQMIDRAGSVALLGYFFVLEGYAGMHGKEVYAILREAHGGRALRFVEEHAVLDADHFPRSLELLNQLGPSDLAVVHQSTRLAGPLYRYMVAAVDAES